MKDRCKQAASGMWYARPTWTDPATGERRFGHVSEPTQRKCADAYLQAVADGRAGRTAVRSVVTVSDVIDEWLAVKRGATKASGFRSYASLARNHLHPRFGRMKVARCTQQAIQRVYAEMLADGASAATVANVHRRLHDVFGLAERRGHVARNPVSLVDPPRHRPPEMETWTAAETDAILRWCATEPVYGPLIALGCYTGMRQGELLALRWGEVDLDGGTVRVRWTAHRGIVTEPKSAASRRSISLSTDCVAMLRAYHAERAALGAANRDHLVFSAFTGSLLSDCTLRRRLSLGCAAAGVRQIRFHGIRHTHATLLLEAGVHPKIVQERLGHASITITLDRYSHAVAGLQRQAAEALDGIIRAKRVQNGDSEDVKTAWT